MRKGLILAGALITVAVLLSAVPRAQAPEKADEMESAQAPIKQTAEKGETLHPGCAITQTMYFSRCGHSVARRVTAPPEVIGGDFAALQAHYDLWRVDSFSGDAVEMSREIDLFCPMHRVIGCNEAGEIVLSRNLYGDGMAIEKIYPLTLEDMAAEETERVRLGIGFDSAEEADAWIAAH